MGLADGFESEHPPLSLPGPFVSERSAIVRVPARVMDGAGHHIAMSGSVAAECVSHEPPGRLALLLEQPTKEAGGGLRVLPCLDEDIEHLAILIHGSIQIAKLSGDTHDDLISEQLIAVRRRRLMESIGISWAEVYAFASDRHIENADPAQRQ